MSVLQRFGDIVESNVLALLEKAENPAKMAELSLNRLNKDLADLTEETAGVMAEARGAKRNVDECKAKIEKADKAARNALSAGNETVAKEAIATKQAEEAKLERLEANLAKAEAAADKVRKLRTKLQNDIKLLTEAKEEIKANSSMTKTIKHMNKMMAGVDTAGSISAIDRAMEKSQRELDKATAAMELNQEDESTDELIDKWANSSDASVDDELARMKAEMGV